MHRFKLATMSFHTKFQCIYKKFLRINNAHIIAFIWPNYSPNHLFHLAMQHRFRMYPQYEHILCKSCSHWFRDSIKFCHLIRTVCILIYLL